MNPLHVVFAVAAVAYVGIVAAGLRGPVRAIKVVPALSLAVALFPTHPIAAAGMVFSAAGDGFLLDKDRFLLAGIGSFLVAHLLFVPAFLTASGAWPHPGVVAALLAVAAGALFAMRPKKPVLKVAVPIYALTLVAMASAATTLGPLGVAGGLTFLVSDSVLSFRLFRRDFPGGDLIVMVTYYGALGLLAAAVP